VTRVIVFTAEYEKEILAILSQSKEKKGIRLFHRLSDRKKLKPWNAKPSYNIYFDTGKGFSKISG